MSGGPAPTGPTPSTSGASVHRESRWVGQGYADITKLREIAAKHERLSTRNQQRAARINTRIEKLRHQAAILREKGQKVLGRIPDIESEIAQLDRDIQARSGMPSAGVPGPDGAIQPRIGIGSDVTSLHYRVRKLQQKVVDLQHKARTYDHRAATRTQKTAELKIKADRYLEQSKIEEAEGQSYRQRADRLQAATEGEVAARLGTSAPAPYAPPPPPPDSL
jgi:predicted ribosome quality control (RQC) complex YloA/Tae2 family protein